MFFYMFTLKCTRVWWFLIPKGSEICRSFFYFTLFFIYWAQGPKWLFQDWLGFWWELTMSEKLISEEKDESTTLDTNHQEQGEIQSLPIASVWPSLPSLDFACALVEKTPSSGWWRWKGRTGSHWLPASSHLSGDRTLWQSHHCLSTQRGVQLAWPTSALEKWWELSLHIY